MFRDLFLDMFYKIELDKDKPFFKNIKNLFFYFKCWNFKFQIIFFKDFL